MSSMLKKDDIGKLTKFLKSYDSSRKSLKAKEISRFLSQGKKSEIISDVHFVSKDKNKINAYAHVLAFSDGLSQISNVIISPTTSEKNLFELISDCINHSFVKKCSNIELVAEGKFERIFKRMNFDKIGEKENQIFMRYRLKREVQSDLRKQFSEAEFIEKIGERTSEQLRKLR